MRQDLPFYLKRTTGILLLLALSAVFLFSAGTKLMAIEPFEWTFLELFSVGFTGAAILARLFIGFELLIAFLLLAHLYLRSFTYKAALVLLLLLTGYLLLLLYKQGNTGNCGCFGDTYQMTPLAAIGKNLAMMLAIGILYRIYPVALPTRTLRARALATVLLVLLSVASLAIPYLTNWPTFSSKGEVTHQPIKLDPIYTMGEPRPAVDLTKGKHIVAYLSLTCPHCRKAAYLIQILHRQYPELPFYMVLNGRKTREQAFFAETKATQVPYSIMRDLPAFSSMAGEYVPAIYWISNSIIERKTYYTELDPKMIKAWLAEIEQ